MRARDGTSDVATPASARVAVSSRGAPARRTYDRRGAGRGGGAAREARTQVSPARLDSTSDRIEYIHNIVPLPARSHGYLGSIFSLDIYKKNETAQTLVK